MTLSFICHAVYIEISGHISTLHVRHHALTIVCVCVNSYVSKTTNCSNCIDEESEHRDRAGLPKCSCIISTADCYRQL